MTEYEKMVKGLIYNPGDEKIMSEQSRGVIIIQSS